MKVEVNYQANIDLPRWLVNELDGDKLLAKLLFRRGVDTPEKLEEYLYPESYQPTSSEEFPELDQVVDLLLEIVAADKKICVYGDYDVDGATSTTILVKMLETIGADVSYHIPDRFIEGYGMDQDVVQELANQGVDLILTCDCGISNHQEVELAKELGMKVVITDHHQLPEQLPQADFILSPKLLPTDHKAYYLPGAGMAYLLAQAILEQTEKGELAKELLDFAALAIVADVVPLLGENRYLLQKGLDSLATTNWVGIQELCQICSIETFNLSEEEIGFQLAPRINATGRIDSAKKAVELLLSSSQKEAKKLARQLDEINNQRKKISDQMEEEALSLLDDPTGPIILYQADWHQGILGIGAGRLTEQYKVPILLMTLKDDGQTVTGSARSITGLHINQALKECKDLLISFGGHAGAAGFSLALEDLSDFKSKLKQVLARKLKDLGNVREIEVDDKLTLEQTSLELYEDIRDLAPFGEENPTPVFYSTAVEIISSRSFSGGKHLNLTLDDGTDRRSAVWWRAEPEKLGSKVDLVYSLGINNWRGNRELQLVIEEVINHTGQLEKRKINYELEDWRNWRQLGDSLPDFKDPIYYYEGIKDLSYQNLINRYQAENKETLVLLTCPPELRIIQDLVQKVEPKKLVLAYSEEDLESGTDFINKLAGLIKNVINSKRGKTDIYTLAALTAQKESTVALGLKYLQQQGLVELEFINPVNLLVKPGVDKVRRSQVQDKLKTLLGETKAFRRYMLQRDLSEIDKLLFGK
ncbi:single-stranded-DNA-specific exonuclease RecJ [Halanaerocella petrolearia]